MPEPDEDDPSASGPPAAAGPPRPWEMQPREPTRAFEAFTLYRDMGPDRSLAKVRRKLGKSTAYVRYIEKWSARWHWVERARQWDAHVDEERRTASARAMERMLERHIRVSEGLQNALLIPARALLERYRRQDKALTDALEKMPAEDLIRLVTQTARAMRTPIVLEWGARGYRPTAGDDAGDEDAGAVELDEVLNRLASLTDAGTTRKPRRTGP